METAPTKKILSSDLSDRTFKENKIKDSIREINIYQVNLIISSI